MDLALFLRILNLVLVVLYFIYLVSLRDWWASKPKEERVVLIANPVILGVTAYASLEGIIQSISPGTRVFLYTPSIILCLFGVFLLRSTIRSNNKDRKEDKKNGKRRQEGV